MLRDLEESYTKGPHIRGNGVRLPSDALRCHIVGGSDKGVSVATGAELAADAEVAEFDLSIAAEEDVGGLDIYRKRVGELEGFGGLGETVQVSVCEKWRTRKEANVSYLYG